MDEEEELENTLIGQEEAPAVNTGDVMMGGLGLGGAAFAAQTGRVPTRPPTRQVLNILTDRDPTSYTPRSAFAQRVAANDAARLAAQFKPPALIGSTQVATTTGFQPPAVTSTTGTPATTGGTLTTTTAGGQTGGGQPRLTGSTRPSADDFDFRINPARASRLARFGGPGTLIYGAADLATEALTDRSLSERIGEGIAGPLANLFIPGAQSQPAFTEAELQQSINNLSPGAQLDIMREDAEASVAPVTDVTPLEAALGALDEEIAGREANIVSNQVELAKQINELGTVSDDQRAVQNFMDERAERSGTTATDVITPFQEQAQLTADLFTDPNTAIGQFVPRATFTLPDGTIIQEDEGGTRRQISAEQLRQFEQDMAGLSQPSVVGLGRGGDAGVIKSFDRPMGVEETQARLQQIAGAPTIREIQEQGAVAPPVAFQDASAEREARLAQRDRLPGETQTERDTRIAQSRTTGGQTEGLSFDDAKRRAEGQLAARGVRNPSASRVNTLARSIQAAEPERLQKLQDQRDLTQRRMDALDAQLAQSGIVPSEPPVVDPETGVITQKYSDGTTRYKGLTRVSGGSNSEFQNIMAGIEAGDTPTVDATDAPKISIDSEFTPKQEADIQKVLAANPNSTRAEVIEAMEKEGKL
tara:strand:- start:3022 stop:4959 length:1938 start_codon:yes stop_codon:yes gene_type:complete